MGIKAAKDVGLGNTAPQAYIRIHDPEFHSGVPEWEFSIDVYYDKDCRNLEIVKEFVQSFTFTTEYEALPDDKKAWLNDQVLSRSARPVQSFKFATKDIERLPPPSTTQITATKFFYGWLKTNPVSGPMDGASDDAETSDNVIAAFKALHPEIFGGA
jgi:hypothetical protein